MTEQQPPVICAFCGKNQEQVRKLVAGPGLYICDECITVCHSVVTEGEPLQGDETAPATEALSGKTLPKPTEIKAILDDHIIGQDYAKRIISVAVYNHYKRLFTSSSKFEDTEIQKSNILLVGPTGTGKTLFAQTLAKLLDVPFAIADATTLTESGYVGEDVESMLFRLLQVCDYDPKKVETGIIYLDEIDKISRKSESASITRDVSGEGVQQGLLKLLEGSEVNVPLRGGRKHPHQEYVTINTANILFITGGAFHGMEDVIKERLNKKNYGFKGKDKENEQVKDSKVFEHVQPEDLLTFGLIPEFIGRLPVLAPLNELDEEAMLQILTQPKNALTKQYQKLMDMDGIALDFEEEALRLIAKIALKRKVGARALRSIIEDIMLEPMFSMPAGKKHNTTLSLDLVKDYLENRVSKSLRDAVLNEENSAGKSSKK